MRSNQAPIPALLLEKLTERQTDEGGNLCYANLVTASALALSSIDAGLS